MTIPTEYLVPGIIIAAGWLAIAMIFCRALAGLERQRRKTEATRRRLGIELQRYHESTGLDQEIDR